MLATSDIGPEKHGVAAAILQTGYQLGAAIVLAATTAVMGGESQQLGMGQHYVVLWFLLSLSVLTIICSCIVPLNKSQMGYVR